MKTIKELLEELKERVVSVAQRRKINRRMISPRKKTSTFKPKEKKLNEKDCFAYETTCYNN